MEEGLLLLSEAAVLASDNDDGGAGNAAVRMDFEEDDGMTSTAECDELYKPAELKLRVQRLSGAWQTSHACKFLRGAYHIQSANRFVRDFWLSNSSDLRRLYVDTTASQEFECGVQVLEHVVCEKPVDNPAAETSEQDEKLAAEKSEQDEKPSAETSEQADSNDDETALPPSKKITSSKYFTGFGFSSFPPDLPPGTIVHFRGYTHTKSTTTTVASTQQRITKQVVTNSIGVTIKKTETSRAERQQLPDPVTTLTTSMETSRSEMQQLPDPGPVTTLSTSMETSRAERQQLPKTVTTLTTSMETRTSTIKSMMVAAGKRKFEYAIAITFTEPMLCVDVSALFGDTFNITEADTEEEIQLNVYSMVEFYPSPLRGLVDVSLFDGCQNRTSRAAIAKSWEKYCDTLTRACYGSVNLVEDRDPTPYITALSKADGCVVADPLLPGKRDSEHERQHAAAGGSSTAIATPQRQHAAADRSSTATATPADSTGVPVRRIVVKRRPVEIRYQKGQAILQKRRARALAADSGPEGVYAECGPKQAAGVYVDRKRGALLCAHDKFRQGMQGMAASNPSGLREMMTCYADYMRAQCGAVITLR